MGPDLGRSRLNTPLPFCPAPCAARAEGQPRPAPAQPPSHAAAADRATPPNGAGGRPFFAVNVFTMGKNANISSQKIKNLGFGISESNQTPPQLKSKHRPSLDLDLDSSFKLHRDLSPKQCFEVRILAGFCFEVL